LEEVSSRLKDSLVHPAKKGVLVGLRYSPDDKRIIGGDYPGGVIQVWDAQSGKQLTKIETGYAYRASSRYFFLSPDWSTVYVCREKRRATALENDKKRLYRWEFDGDVRAWDLSTGQLRSTFKHDPPRGVVDMVLSPDGSAFVTFEELSGESERPQRSASLWKVESKEHRPLPSNVESWAVYSADGRALAAPVETEKGRATAVRLIDLATAQAKASIAIAEENVTIGYIAFSPDNRLLVGQVRSLRYQIGEHWLKFWNAGTGQEVASFKGENKDVLVSMVFSPDGRTLAVNNVGGSRGGPGKLFLFDPRAKRLVATTNLGEKTSVGEPAFSPDGNWIAVQTQAWPDGPPRDTADPQDFPQPRIFLIDAATGTVRTTLVAPQGFGTSACFSRDGKMLATSGDGKVLLWDLSKPVIAVGPGGDH
jgi:WD40 repeat protein